MADKNKKYKLTCPAIGYENTVEAIDSDIATVDALTDIGMNIHEYIKIEVKELKK